MATIEHGLRQRQVQEKKGGINKKFAALALTGVVALGGIGFIASQQNEQTKPEPTPISGGVGNPNNSPETNNPSPTEIITGELLTDEQKAKAEILNVLWQAAHINEKKGLDTDRIRTSIQLEPINPDSWQEEINQIIHENDKENKLVVGFAITNLYGNNGSSEIASGDKFIGEFELSNVGLRFREGTNAVELSAELRERGFLYNISEGNKNLVENLLDEKTSIQLPDFSSESTEYRIILHVNKNENGWEITGFNMNWLYSSIESLGTSTCSTNENSSCQIKNITP